MKGAAMPPTIVCWLLLVSLFCRCVCHRAGPLCITPQHVLRGESPPEPAAPSRVTSQGAHRTRRRAHAASRCAGW